MKLDDFIICFTAAYLKSPPSTQQQAAEDKSIASYGFLPLRTPDKISVGFKDAAGIESTTFEFSQKLGPIKGASLEQAVYQDTRLEAHVAAAFMGTSRLVLKVATFHGDRYFYLRTELAPTYALTPAELVQLIDAQPDSKGMWSVVEAKLNQSHELNHKALVPVGTIRSFMLNPTGPNLIESNLSDFFTDLQIEAIVTGKELILPAHLKDRFIKYPRMADPIVNYSGKPVTGKDVVELIQAQPQSEKILAALSENLDFYLEEKKLSPPVDWIQIILALTDEELQQIIYHICGTVDSVLSKNNLKAIFPAHLKSLFEPEIRVYEDPRVRARVSVSDGGWSLERTEHPWQLNLFVEVPVSTLKLVPKRPLEEVKQEFLKSCEQAGAFALKFKSRFAVAFQLMSLMEKDQKAQSLFLKNDFPAFYAYLKDLKLGEDAEAILSYEESTFMQLTALGVSGPVRMNFCLYALISSIFGGMGSWSDQYFDKDQDEYERLTKDLFDKTSQFLLSIFN